MGTEITLEVGGLTVDWSKNGRGTDHGVLFQAKDRKRMRSEQIDYNWHTENNEDPGPMEMGFIRPLREVLPRIELLGFTLDRVRGEYDGCVRAWSESQDQADDNEQERLPALMTFAEFSALATSYPVQSLNDTYTDNESQAKGRFNDEALQQRIPHHWDHDLSGYSERSYFGRLIGILSPYSLLRMLAQNPANLDTDVVWQYGPLVEAGWANQNEFEPEARRIQTFLIATEGSSDAHILKHGISLLNPEISDFFRFIDVSERHPFPGTGNLVKFAEGLAKIDVQNQIVFLFDNDAEGFDAYSRVLRLNLPPNMRAIILPELEQFRAFPAVGPDGITSANINRRAAAIECYLDLLPGDVTQARVIWTNFKKELGVYQGALEHKENYTKKFLRQTAESIFSGSYDLSKLRILLDSLFAECVLIPEAALRSTSWPPTSDW